MEGYLFRRAPRVANARLPASTACQLQHGLPRAVRRRMQSNTTRHVSYITHVRVGLHVAVFTGHPERVACDNLEVSVSTCCKNKKKPPRRDFVELGPEA
jgi:hypothetical protein